MIEYLVVEYEDVVEQIKEHIHATHDEVGPFKERKLSPDFDAYQTHADNGILAIFAAMDGDNLIGYAVFVLGNHIFYDDLILAQSDLIYIVPEHRGETSKEFIQFIDEKLYTDFGVDGIVISMTTKRNFSGLLEHLGYQTVGVVCSKYVGDD